MRIALINTPDWDRLISRDMAGGLGFDRNERMLLPPLDLLSYHATLIEHGDEAILIDAQALELDFDRAVKAVEGLNPKAAIITLSLPTLEQDAKFARAVKNILKDGVVAVKTGITYAPIVEKILSESGCDFCITGECDLTIAAVLRGVDKRGTHWLDAGLVKSSKEILIEDLDALPIPDRGGLPHDLYRYSRLGSRVATVQTSRGCPFSCSYYCPYPLVQGKKWRAMSARRIFEEMKSLHALGIEKVLFRDATFTLDRNRIVELCELIISSGMKIEWQCETRIDKLDAELITLMSRAGCRGANVGVETGDEELMSSLAKRGLTLENLKNISGHSKKIGFALHFLLMLGLPGESKKSLEATLKLIKELKPESIGITTVTPYPGTKLYEDAINNKWIKDWDFSAFGGHGFNMELPGLSSETLRNAMEAAHKLTKATGMEAERIITEFMENL